MTSDLPLPPPPEPRIALAFPLQDGERVLEYRRKHWVFLWPRMILMALITLMPPAVIAALLSVTDTYEGTPATVFWIASALWFAYRGVVIFLAWYRYHNDIWVVTNQRLIDSIKTSPFNLKVSSADLINVQDMTVERRGVLRTILDYGDVLCQTAAEQQEFLIAGIPHPREMQALVDRERDRERMRAV